MSRSGRAWTILALAGLALLAAGLVRPATAAPSFPPLTGRVVDQANVLPAATAADLTARLEGLQARTTRQLVVVTVPSLQGYDIADYGYQLGRAWGVGQKGLDNGALLIVAPNERKVRIEIGYGLEGMLTDALSNVILQTRVLPRFKAGDIPGGVVAGADALVEQLSLDPSVAEQRAAAAATASARRAPPETAPSPAAIVFLILFALWMVRAVLRGGRRRGLGGLWAAPIIFGGGGRRWNGDDGGGGFGGGGFGGGGGGGFSGGGGSFGGGGSSGSW